MIDAHVHAFPDAPTGRVWQESAGFAATRPGTIDDLTSRMGEAGIERAILLLFYRSARRYGALRDDPAEARSGAELRLIVRDELRALNRWGCEVALKDARFVPFVGVDPGFLDADELVVEIATGAASGARGVKIVPPAMARYPDDEALGPVFATCVDLGLTVLSQSGAGGSATPGPRGHFGRPAGWHAVLDRHPRLRVILAHLGRGYADELVELVEQHAGAHSDLSLSLGHPREPDEPDLDAIRRLVRRLGAERVLFGTNYPIGDPLEYRTRFEALGLTSGEAAAIGGANAARLLAPDGR